MSKAAAERLLQRFVTNEESTRQRQLAAQKVVVAGGSGERAKTTRAVRKQRKADRAHHASVNKRARYELIMAHAANGTLAPEEDKYVAKLVRRNVGSVTLWDAGNKDELAALQAQVLAEKSTKHLSAKKRAQAERQRQFASRVKRGVLATPGLTPGLAPVGAESESESE